MIRVKPKPYYCDTNRHPNDVHIVKKEYAPGKETYFVKGKKVDHRVTSISNIFWPFDSDYWANFVLERTTKNPKYIHIIKNTNLNDKEKLSEIKGVWGQAAQDGTDVHLLPELHTLHEKQLRNLFINEMIKKLQTIVNSRKKKEHFKIHRFRKSFEQYLRYHNEKKQRGWIPFKPEWKVYHVVRSLDGAVLVFGGTVDQTYVYQRQDGGWTMYIVDWKHMKTLKKNSRTDNFPYFITSIKDKIYVKELQYYMQLNIYRHFVENGYLNKPFYVGGKRIRVDKVKVRIVCLHEDLKEYRVFKPLDLRKDVKALFELFRDGEVDKCKNAYKYDYKINFRGKGKRKRYGESGSKYEPSKKRARTDPEPSYSF